MLMFALLTLPLALQGLAILFDEFYYHHRRGLPLWERVGHPVDTIFALAPLAGPLFFTFDSTALSWFAGAAFFSSILITKDEFVHHEYCEPAEQWLHSVLFVLHPMVYAAIAGLWYLKDVATSTAFQMGVTPELIALGLRVQVSFVLIMLVYQIIYWNLIWPKKQQSITPYTTR